MMAKYYLELRIEPNLMVSLRVYRDDPRKFGGAASMEAVKMRNFDTSQLDPAKVRINANFSNSSSNEYGYTPDGIDGIVEWLGVTKDVAIGFDSLIKEVADLERVMIEPGYDNTISVSEDQGTITIRFPDAWETL